MLEEDNIGKDEEIYDDKTYRAWMILFYDTSNYYKLDDLIFNIKSLKYYAYIKHQPESDEKQAHYHAYIRLDSACTQSAISKRLGIPQNYIKHVKNVRGACRYLTHVDYPNKIQYNISDVVISRNIQRKFLKQFEDLKTEEEILQDIYFWLDNSHFADYYEKLKYFIIFINMNCYDTIYKRYRYELNEYLKRTI